MGDFVGNIVKQLRVQHWVKNLLVFSVPLTAHLHTGYGIVFLGFISFCFLSSAIYVFNDLIDIEFDRLHPVKKNRPIASNRISIREAQILFIVLITIGVFIAYWITMPFLWIVLGYIGLNLLYTLRLKQVQILDVVCLAGMFMMRTFAGSAICSIRTGEWFITYCLFLFISLAFLKRYVELSKSDSIDPRVLDGRGYTPDDRWFLQTAGFLCAMTSVLVLCLYLNSERVKQLYEAHDLIWITAPLYLYWVLRIWFMANRGLIEYDPVDFALKDRVSYILGLTIIIIVYLAI